MVYIKNLKTKNLLLEYMCVRILCNSLWKNFELYMKILSSYGENYVLEIKIFLWEYTCVRILCNWLWKNCELSMKILSAYGENSVLEIKTLLWEYMCVRILCNWRRKLRDTLYTVSNYNNISQSLYKLTMGVIVLKRTSAQNLFINTFIVKS
jgi:hypothetical protein